MPIVVLKNKIIIIIIPVEQKAMKRSCRECIDALLLDDSVRRRLAVKYSTASMAWIDYQKAYDRVPHGWLLRVLEIMRK